MVWVSIWRNFREKPHWLRKKANGMVPVIVGIDQRNPVKKFKKVLVAVGRDMKPF